MRTKNEALKEAKKVKKLLDDPRGWKVRVWKNLGWHLALEKGGLSLRVRKNYDGNVYDVLFSIDPKHVGTGEMYLSTGQKSSKNPNVVIEHQLNVVQRHIKKATRMYRKSF